MRCRHDARTAATMIVRSCSGWRPCHDPPRPAGDRAARWRDPLRPVRAGAPAASRDGRGTRDTASCDEGRDPCRAAAPHRARPALARPDRGWHQHARAHRAARAMQPAPGRAYAAPRLSVAPHRPGCRQMPRCPPASAAHLSPMHPPHGPGSNGCSPTRDVGSLYGRPGGLDTAISLSRLAEATGNCGWLNDWRTHPPIHGTNGCTGAFSTRRLQQRRFAGVSEHSTRATKRQTWPRRDRSDRR